MNHSTSGCSGLRVSRLALGAMTFGAGSGIWESIAGVGLRTRPEPNEFGLAATPCTTRSTALADGGGSICLM
jgi:hypothetical protein